MGSSETLRGPDKSRQPGVHQLVGEIPAAYKMKDVSPTFEAHCPGVSLMLESGSIFGTLYDSWGAA